MKNFRKLKPTLFLLMLVFLGACSGGNQKKRPAADEQKAAPVEINGEARALLDYLRETGDYVNSRNFPSLIKASSVFEELDGNIHIVDLRGPESFKAGHIKGAVRVEFGDLPAHFTNDIKPFEFDKIILVCYGGQISSYATSLLRLMGYGNVYALRWGMSGWNSDFAAAWNDEISSAYEKMLEKGENQAPMPGDFPLLNTGGNTGEEIFDARIKTVFEEGAGVALIKANEVFRAPENYFIINYERKDKYESGHIPGAVRYKPGGTLGIASEMQTIPAGREIVVYCGTGHNSGFATAFLRLFGYNAKTLLYGNNAFMHNKMIAERSSLSWLPFTEAEIEDFPYVK